MPEPFCELEPNSDAEKSFVRAVKDHDADHLRSVLTANPQLSESINEPWFDFDAPAVVWCSGHLDEEKIRTLLEFGADIDAKSTWAAGGYTALHHCVDSATPEKLGFAKFLISCGATVDLHSAAGLGNLDLLCEFLDADPGRINERGPDGAMPLHLAANVDVAKLLLDRGADPAGRCVDHNSTPGMWLLGSYPEVSRYITERGGPADIFMAAAFGDPELVEKCLTENSTAISARVGGDNWTEHTGGGDKYTWSLKSHSPQKLAYDHGHTDLYHNLLARSPLDLRMQSACECGDRKTAENLAAANPNLVSELPPNRARALADAAWEGNLEAVRLMLDLGFDPHVVGDHDSTPLDRASFHGFSDVVKLLLERDPDPQLRKQNEFGGMPLGTCLWGQIHGWTKDSDYPGAVRALLDAGAKFHAEWLPYPNKEIDAILQSYPNSILA